jgi:hypothetical protein
MAARSESATQWVGTLAALGLGSACSNPCAEPPFVPPPTPDPSASVSPQVMRGEWIAPGLLELQFSAPLGASGPLDPNRFAILSWDAAAQPDYAEPGGTCYRATRYRPLRTSYYYRVAVADVWIAPEDDTLLRVRLNSSTAQCLLTTVSVGSGIMLAYTNTPDPAAGGLLLDENGNAVFDLGPEWAIENLDQCLGCDNNYYFADEHLPLFDSLAQIPCP